MSRTGLHPSFAGAESNAASMLPLGTNTVVIADDFAAFRGLVRSKLQENGFQIVAEASDGLEALARVAELQPDLVLLDIVMPNLN